MKEIELKRHPDTEEEIQEVWSPVPGYDDWYEVSNYGRVRSWKNGKWGRRDEPRILRGGIDSNGYPMVSLHNDGPKTLKIHRLVAAEFRPNPENKPQVNHKDGIKTNNFYLNLEWSYPLENVSHSWKNNLATPNKGEDNGASKIKKEDVIRIRSLYGDYNQYEIADMYGIHQTQVSNIIRKKHWKDI